MLWALSWLWPRYWQCAFKVYGGSIHGGVRGTKARGYALLRRERSPHSKRLRRDRPLQRWRIRGLLEGALSKIGRAGCLLVDLRGIEFMDARGLYSLLGIRRQLYARPREGLLAVVCTGKIEKLIRSSGLYETLFTCRDLKEALNGCKVPAQA